VGRDCFVGAGAVVVESHLWAGKTFRARRIPLFLFNVE
jgi:hypothetical protein